MKIEKKYFKSCSEKNNFQHISSQYYLEWLHTKNRISHYKTEAGVFKDTQGQKWIPKQAFITSWKHTYIVKVKVNVQKSMFTTPQKPDYF